MNKEQQDRANKDFIKFQEESVKRRRGYQRRAEENDLDRNGTSISDILSYIFIFIVIGFIIWVALNMFSII